MADPTTAGGVNASGRLWPSTIWTLIRLAREGGPEDRREARERLCQAYYSPVLRFFRKVLRVDEVQAEDLTQDFFTRFIEKDFLKNVTYEKSFRGFLKVACRRHFINWLEARRASGAKVPLPDGEAPPPAERIDSMLDEEMRSHLLEQAVERLRASLLKDRKDTLLRVFEARSGLSGAEPAGYRDLAERFGISVYDVGNNIAAARRLLRQILLDLASARSDDPHEELRELGLLEYLH